MTEQPVFNVATQNAEDNLKNPSVAIVLLNWNGQNYLEKFLPSVMATRYTNKRIIVVDNASTDQSIAFLEKNYPTVERIQNNTNEGFAKGYNTALKQVDSDYYVLLNTDVEVMPDWINPVIELMENDKSIAACQPKILSYSNKALFEYAGACGGWIDYLGYPFSRGRVFDTCEKDLGQYDDVAPCFWATGAAFFVRANIFQTLNGFDEYFFAHQEEIDFCWRAQLSGFKIFVQPKSVVYHVGGGTLSTGSRFKTFLNFRNNLIMLWKNLPLSKKLYIFPFRILLDIVSAYKGLLGGNWGYFISIAKAHLHFTGWLVSKKNGLFNSKQKSGTFSGWMNKSVVWAYFIKNQKQFNEIIKQK